MRGNITRRGRRSWRLKFDVDTISGARRIRYVTVKGTRRDAETELARLLHKANTGVAVDLPKIFGPRLSAQLARGHTWTDTRLARDLWRVDREADHPGDRAHATPEASTGSRQGYDGCHPRAWRITVWSPNFEGCIAVSG